MSFSSPIFLFIFLPLLLIAYFLPLGKVVNIRKYRNCILLLASLVFYWWGAPIFIHIMLFSILVNWLIGMWIDKDRTHTKAYVLFACIWDLGTLFVFKYLGFFTENIAYFIHDNNVIVKIALPLGISFFTFQMLSYVFDVANNTEKCQKNLLDLSLYIVMFPQLVAGPIVRYSTVADEIKNRKESFEEFSDGMCRLIKGLAKKVILADTMGVLTDLIFGGSISSISIMSAWLGAIAYTLQIFYDFSGYSDMAIGLGKMFGFHFLENFNYPYISKSISEFWRRWHISMGSWFRDYVYIPLGGSRVDKKWKVYRNLAVVWLLTGIWHGANWTFIIWGAMYGLLICFEKLVCFEKKATKLGVLSHVYTMFFVIIGWVVFRADSLGQAASYISAMFGLNGNSFVGGADLLLQQFWFYILIGILCVFPLGKIPLFQKGFLAKVKEPVYTVGMMVLLMVTFIYIIKGGYSPFIYFNF